MPVTFKFAHVIRGVIVAVCLPALASADELIVTTSGGATTDTVCQVPFHFRGQIRGGRLCSG
jgi:hypothetical protein